MSSEACKTTLSRLQKLFRAAERWTYVHLFLECSSRWHIAVQLAASVSALARQMDAHVS